MFLGFLLFLRSGGFKVSLHDWLALTEGLHQGLHGQSFQGFYILCRTLLVKTESDLDKFDGMFYQYFKTVDSAKISQELKELSADPETAAKAFAAGTDLGTDAKAGHSGAPDPGKAISRSFVPGERTAGRERYRAVLHAGKGGGGTSAAGIREAGTDHEGL